MLCVSVFVRARAMFALHQDIVRRRKEEAKRRHEVHRKLAAQGIVGRTRHEDPEEGRRLDEQLRKVCRGELAMALADGVGEGLKRLVSCRCC